MTNESLSRTHPDPLRVDEPGLSRCPIGQRERAAGLRLGYPIWSSIQHIYQGFQRPGE